MTLHGFRSVLAPPPDGTVWAAVSARRLVFVSAQLPARGRGDEAGGARLQMTAVAVRY